jgi:leader peptidase (prepilin peptidase)/N-methyltransferase
MIWLVAFILGLFGLILGSFYNVCGLRIPKNQSIVQPGSYCPHCHETLQPLHLIPVFSFLLLHGKCHYCGRKLSFVYPFVELATAFFFAAAPLIVGMKPELIVCLSLISLLVIVFVSDITYMIIPDKVLLFFAVAFVLLRLVIPLEPWWDAVFGALAGFVLLFLFAVISRGSLGGGDIKLFTVFGLVLGFYGTWLALILSTFFGAIIGTFLLLTGRVKKGQPVPFGPFIVLGTLTAYFWGEELLNWYVRWL